MSTAKHRLRIITGPAGAPWCVLGAASAMRDQHVAWTGPFEAFDALEIAGKLLGEGAIFSAELTARWGSLVVCTAAFLAQARAKERNPAESGPPGGFEVEVLS